MEQLHKEIEMYKKGYLVEFIYTSIRIKDESKVVYNLIKDNEIIYSSEEFENLYTEFNNREPNQELIENGDSTEVSTD